MQRTIFLRMSALGLSGLLLTANLGDLTLESKYRDSTSQYTQSVISGDNQEQSEHTLHTFTISEFIRNYSKPKKTNVSMEEVDVIDKDKQDLQAYSKAAVNSERPKNSSNNQQNHEIKVAGTDSKSTAKDQASQVSRGSYKVDILIDNALSLQGVPYKWGGTTRKGFDCSGFVQYVYQGSGIYLPRTSFAMYNVGVSVKREDLQPGDLVFFSTYTKGASDVRIYIGGGRTIGAANDGVEIHNLSESFWSEHYLGARRVLR